ncbi:MAG: Uma2 family endonuclease [Clostridiales bacterium]|nr:Uma2 family endonuclease [Clostridiales bacterium]
MDAGKPKLYTYEDWLKLDDGKRYELLDGQLIEMAVPLTQHQDISYEIGRQLGNAIRGKCRVLPAPFGVRLFKDKNTVLQPDISVVCDRSKITREGCVGAPDMVVEVLSKSTAGFDKLVKFNKYLEAGVREYWIVDPENKMVTAFRLSNGEYVAKVFGNGEKAEVAALEDCVIDLGFVFFDYGIDSDES